MAKVKIQGHASGTGVLTVTAPNTSTDRTITLPDSTGTLIADNGSGKVGIGVTSPAVTLELAGGGGAIRVPTGGELQFGGDANKIYGHASNNYLRFDTNSTERMRVTDNGLTFNGDTAAANALDDYEEGTHTVTVTMGTGTVALHSNHRTFQYTKIGRVVHISGQVLIDSANSEDGEFQMTLPFTVGNGASFYSVGNYRTYNVDTPNDGVQAVVFANSNEAKCNFAWSRDAATPTNERATVNGFYMIGLTYMT